eukprot:5985917-Pyramimonas_sp.AAC.1
MPVLRLLSGEKCSCCSGAALVARCDCTRTEPLWHCGWLYERGRQALYEQALMSDAILSQVGAPPAY